MARFFCKYFSGAQYDTIRDTKTVIGNLKGISFKA